MKIGLASDSHGNVDGLERAFDRMLELGAERIFFLGGSYGDVDRVLDRRRGRAAPGGEDLDFLRAVEGALAGGTRAADADRLSRVVVRVASRGCPEYAAREGARKVMDMVGGLLCCLVHDKGELSRDDISNATVLFHGHAGQAKLVQIGPRYFVTPGHLRAHGAGGPATFALLDVDEQKIDLAIYGLDGGAAVWREKAAIGSRNRVSVK